MTCRIDAEEASPNLQAETNEKNKCQANYSRFKLSYFPILLFLSKIYNSPYKHNSVESSYLQSSESGAASLSKVQSS